MTLPADGFAITREQRGSTVRLIVSGDLDIATAPRLRDRYECEHREAGAAIIVLDLSGVTFLDSSGLHALIDAHEIGAGAERLRIILSDAAARIIELTGLRDDLPIIEPDGPGR